MRLLIALAVALDSVACGSLPLQNLGPQQSDGGTGKKRRKRRRKPRPDEREESEDEDMFTIDLSSDEEAERGGGRYTRCV